MKSKNSKNIFLNNFINESYTSIEGEVKKIINKLDETIISLNENEYSDEEEAIKNWGGVDYDDEEEFSPEEFFGAAGDAAEEDIKNDPEWGGKYGFAAFGTTEDPRMLKKLTKENEEEAIKNWGGIDYDDEEEFSPEEFFGAAGDAAEEDIKNDPEWGGKYGFAAFGTTEDPRMLKKLTKESLRKEIRKILKENFDDLNESDENIDEERIANSKAKKEVDNLENFIGSHIYGEDLGGLGKMYVAYSYGEQFPVYINYKGKWYHNTDYYIVDGDRINKPTEKHKIDMKPSKKTQGMSLKGMQSLIKKFKNKYDIGDNNHKDVEPGEKN